MWRGIKVKTQPGTLDETVGLKKRIESDFVTCCFLGLFLGCCFGFLLGLQLLLLLLYAQQFPPFADLRRGDSGVQLKSAVQRDDKSLHALRRITSNILEDGSNLEVLLTCTSVQGKYWKENKEALSVWRKGKEREGRRRSRLPPF